MSQLDDILSRFQARPGGSSDVFQIVKIHTAIRQAYDLGFLAASKSGMPKTESRAQLIEHMLTEVEESNEEQNRVNLFIESLRDQFDRVGTLSPKQVEALRKFYDRV